MKVLIKILKFTAGTILGLASSFLIIWGLDAVISLDATKTSHADLWLIGGLVSVCVFICNYLFFIGSSSKKIHTQGIELLPESIGELIDGIIDAMKYRRSVRAEVRQELTDHFTDALAECETEEEKQAATKELIEGFGDIELLGKLLKRAKKRCRPLWRTVVARAFQLIGLSILLLIFYIGWFFTGKPKITTNYLDIMNQQVRPIADDSQNAWPHYKQAAEKFVKYEDGNEDEKFDFHPTSPSPFTRSEQDLQVIQQSISDNQGALELIRQGNQKPYYWREYGVQEPTKEDRTELTAIYVPHLSDYRNLTYLMCWQGLLSAEQGDFERAFDIILETYSFGQHLRGQNITLIEQLVAMSIEWTSTDILRMFLTEYGKEIDVPVLNSVPKRLEAMIADKDFAIDFDSEKLFMRDEAQRCFTQSRFGKSHIYLPRLKQFGLLEIDRLDITDKEALAVWIKGGLHVLFTHPDKEQTLRDVERFYAEIEKLSVLTPASVKEQGLDMDEFAEEAMSNSVFLSILMPALTKLVTYSHRSRVDSEATLATLAILQYEKEHGEYPESLDALVKKELLKAVPMDPYSDKPLIYRKTDDDFILYSIGYNFTDDGGVVTGKDRQGRPKIWADDGDAVFWPVDVQ
ncbi:MAG: hypothetical protein OEV87_03155 [Phycisphaerae bacterium]|nr:hypothetical protein [Phycisphaerae bacterium]